MIGYWQELVLMGGIQSCRLNIGVNLEIMVLPRFGLLASEVVSWIEVLELEIGRSQCQPE